MYVCLFIYFYSISSFCIGVKLLFYAVEFQRTKVNILQVSLFLLKKKNPFSFSSFFTQSLKQKSCLKPSRWERLACRRQRV